MKYKVKLENNDHNLLPVCKGDAAGYDLKIKESIKIPAKSTVFVGTGVYLEIADHNIVGKVYPRSGLSTKKGIILANSVGIIDCDYRGEIKLALVNTSNEEVVLDKYDRVAQLLFTVIAHPDLVISDTINETQRGEGGFGSTGTKN